MTKKNYDRLNGPLYDPASKQRVEFIPYVPSQDLSFFVEQYWTVRWDVRDQAPFRTEHVPDPSVHVIVEKDLSGVFGPARGRFSRLVEDAGYAFCIKFRPGAFYPFTRSPVSGLKNKTVSLSDIFGSRGHDLERDIRGAVDEELRIEVAENFLRSLHPEHDDSLALIHQIIACIVSEYEIMRSYDLVSQFYLTERTLQRLFNRYVGVSPSWVIRRYRIHDAIAQLDQGEVLDWPALAVDLGYFDQSHFIKDFKNIIGVSPVKYMQRSIQVENA
jgi:AraC-like DNA-binding protein